MIGAIVARTERGLRYFIEHPGLSRIPVAGAIPDPVSLGDGTKRLPGSGESAKFGPVSREGAPQNGSGRQVLRRQVLSRQGLRWQG